MAGVWSTAGALDGGLPKTLGGFHDTPNVEVHLVAGAVLNRAFEVGVVYQQCAVEQGMSDNATGYGCTVAIIPLRGFGGYGSGEYGLYIPLESSPD